MSTAFLFPGQASQYVGMGKDLYDASPIAKRVFDLANGVLDIRIKSFCFCGPEESLRQTAITQPAVFTHSIAALEMLRANGVEPDIVAGHSVGELAALVCAGALETEDGLRLVSVRAQAMSAAGKTRPGTMAAIIGLDDKGVRAGHKLFNSATGALCSTMELYMIHIDMDARRAVPMAADKRGEVEAAIAVWDGPEREERAQPASDERFILTHRDTTKPWEIDVVGHVGFQFYIHRFSSAGAQLFAAMGLDSGYQREHRLGFSTFEFQVRFQRELNAGAIVDVKSALVHMGGSSIRVQHRLYNAATNELSAVLDQFGVMLDLDARRPKRISDDIRQRAEPFLIAV